MQTSQPLLRLKLTTWDVVVVGAGIAGTVMARELAREGLKVLLIDKKRFPRAKVCGACLNGLALSVLDHFGLTTQIKAAGGVPLHTFSGKQSGRELNLKMLDGLAISRTTLDPILAQAAVDAGALFQEETTVSLGVSGQDDCKVALERHGEHCEISARIVVVAAGLAPQILANQMEFESIIQPNSKIGAGCIINEAPESYRSGVIYMAVGKAGYVGLVRVEGNQMDVAAAFDPQFMKMQESPGKAAQFVIQEAGFVPIPGLDSSRCKWLGTPALTRRTRSIASDRVFLLGDSAGYVEPFTGEGMGWALASVVLLKPILLKAVKQWRNGLAEEWQTAYQGFVGNRQRLCKLLARSLARPKVSMVAFRFARIAPGLTGKMVRNINAPFKFSSERIENS